MAVQLRTHKNSNREKIGSESHPKNKEAKKKKGIKVTDWRKEKDLLFIFEQLALDSLNLNDRSELACS